MSGRRLNSLGEASTPREYRAVRTTATDAGWVLNLEGGKRVLASASTGEVQSLQELESVEVLSCGPLLRCLQEQGKDGDKIMSASGDSVGAGRRLHSSDVSSVLGHESPQGGDNEGLPFAVDGTFAYNAKKGAGWKRLRLKTWGRLCR